MFLLIILHSIPKKLMMKLRITVAFFLFGIFLIACSENKVRNQPDEASLKTTSSISVGEQIYDKYCKLCHGKDGKLGLNGAKDITASVLTLEERILLIKNGKNTMTPFEGILSEEEIKAVARYSMSLQ